LFLPNAFDEELAIDVPDLLIYSLLFEDIDPDQQGETETGCKTEDLNSREEQMLPELPNGDDKIISDHGLCYWVRWIRANLSVLSISKSKFHNPFEIAWGISNYSVLKLFTGLAMAARIAWMLIVTRARIKAMRPASGNTHQ
jgi:hypothetical protein